MPLANGSSHTMHAFAKVDEAMNNRALAALKYNEVESVLESGDEEDIFSPEFIERLADVKMPATKLEMLVKLLRKQILEYATLGHSENRNIPV